MKNKVIAGIFGILFGGIGIHHFYLGDTKKGLIYLLCSILLCWTLIVPLCFSIAGLIEGIILLCKDDNEFDDKYNNGAHSASTALNNAQALSNYHALLNKGAITLEEYEKKKAELM